MTSPTHGLLRLTRAGAFGVTVMALALVAHVGAGGVAPPLPVLACLALLVALPCVWLTARRRGLLAILGAMGLGQLLLHESFTALAASDRCHPATGPGHAGHVGHLTGSMTVTCVPGGAAMSHVPLAMLLAHGLATLALSWLLADGERTLWRLLDHLARRAPATLPHLREAIPAPRLHRSRIGGPRRRRGSDPCSPRAPPAASVAAGA